MATTSSPKPSVGGSGMNSILKKTLVALTGLALIGFLVTHLAGNLFLFGGSTAFDGYAARLEAMGPLLIVAEIGLAAIFVAHVVLAIKLTVENKAARGSQGYAVNDNQSEAPSRFMIVSGVLVALFVILHVRGFKFGPREEFGGSLYALVMNEFANPGVAIFYIFSMLILGTHLTHGFWSLFQTLGLIKPEKRRKVKQICTVLGWGIALGFLVLPLFGLLSGKKRTPLPEGVKELIQKTEAVR